MNEDQTHLKYLFYGYIASGVLTGLIALFPVIHLVFGFSMLFGAFEGSGDAPPRALGFMFVAIGGGLILFFLTWSLLNFLTAFSIKNRKRKMLIYVMAAISCTSIPLGTLLGVFTFLVMTRDTVKPMFESGGLQADI